MTFILGLPYRVIFSRCLGCQTLCSVLCIHTPRFWSWRPLPDLSLIFPFLWFHPLAYRTRSLFFPNSISSTPTFQHLLASTLRLILIGMNRKFSAKFKSVITFGPIRFPFLLSDGIQVAFVCYLLPFSRPDQGRSQIDMVLMCMGIPVVISL